MTAPSRAATIIVDNDWAVARLMPSSTEPVRQQLTPLGEHFGGGAGRLWGLSDG